MVPRCGCRVRMLTVARAESLPDWGAMAPGSIALAGAALVLLASVACGGDTPRADGSAVHDSDHGLMDATAHAVSGRPGPDGRCEFSRVVFSGHPDGAIDVLYKLAGDEPSLVRSFSEGGPIGARTTDRDVERCSEVVVTGLSAPSAPPADGTSISEEVRTVEWRPDATPGPP